MLRLSHKMLNLRPVVNKLALGQAFCHSTFYHCSQPSLINLVFKAVAAGNRVPGDSDYHKEHSLITFSEFHCRSICTFLFLHTFWMQPTKDVRTFTFGDTMSKFGTPPMYRFWGRESCVKAPGAIACVGAMLSTCRIARRPVRERRNSCHSPSDTGSTLLQHMFHTGHSDFTSVRTQPSVQCYRILMMVWPTIRHAFGHFYVHHSISQPTSLQSGRGVVLTTHSHLSAEVKKE